MQKALESQPTVEDKYYAVRPVCDTGSSWTAVGNNVSVSGWSSAPHQTWKIVGCRSAEVYTDNANPSSRAVLHFTQTLCNASSYICSTAVTAP